MDKKSFVVIGLGKFGLAVARTLVDLKCECLAIDNTAENVAKAAEFMEHVVICDTTHYSNLADLGVAKYGHAILGMGDYFEATLLTVMNLKDLGVNEITVRVSNKKFANIIEKLGIHDIITPEEDSGISIANRIVNEDFINYYPVAKGYGIVQINTPANFKPITVIELDSRNRFDVNIVAIIKANEEFSIPLAYDLIMPKCVLVVIGKTQKVARFNRFISESK
ncbi:MAG: TrkA family potassium uptake protein [Acholeplasmatales bacterium]|jgi:trk system potassium uptake protein TrkA|nr:TrkA family potassium uptake protein [Acholeplasmatales bacterium]